MNSKKLNDWAQVVGIFALVASLIFVGFQLKQDQQIAQAAIYQERALSVRETFWDVAGNPGLIETLLLADGLDPLEIMELSPDTTELHLTQAQVLTIGYYNFGLLMVWDNAHYQNSLGYLPDTDWEATRNGILEYLRSSPSMRYALDDMLELGEFRQPFLNVMKELRDEAAQNPG